MESKVDFVAVDFPQANRLTVHILAAVAEHEAHMISEMSVAFRLREAAAGIPILFGGSFNIQTTNARQHARAISRE